MLSPLRIKVRLSGQERNQLTNHATTGVSGFALPKNASQALLTGSTAFQEDGRLRVEFRLWDVFAEQQMIGFAYFTVPQNWRRLAHKISDAVYKRITGEEGYFDTRIVYISETGPLKKRIKQAQLQLRMDI